MNRQTLGVDAGTPPGEVVQVRVNRVAGWRAVARVLRSPAFLLHDLVTTVFPADCRCCGGPLLEAGPVPVCESCIGLVRRSTMPGCDRCGEALDLGWASEQSFEELRFGGMLVEGLLCRECRMVPPEFDRAVAYSTYDDELRALIQMLKFDGVAGVAPLLGERLAQAILLLEKKAARELLLVAVPLHRARQKQRGYNQSVLLATHALRRLKVLRPDWKLTEAHGTLVRKRPTESQYVLSRKGRRRNLRGAFAVTADVRGHEVLLVDDILTSGATARECARLLKAAGAAKVWVATVARAQKQAVRRQHEDPGELVAHWDAPATPQVQ